MMTRLLLLGCCATALAAAEAPPAAPQVVEPPATARQEGLDRVISSTKQFTINGGTPETRAAAAMLAEEAKGEMSRLLQEPNNAPIKGIANPAAESDWWKVPISITLHGKQGDPLPRRTIATRILIRETGFEVHLDVHLSRGIENERLKYGVTGAMIYARSLKDRPTAESETPFLVPPWLNDGLREATAWKENRSDRNLYEALFRSGGLFKLDDLFSLDERGFEEMDGAMRAAFRISSGSLVMALLEQSQGKEGFRAFVTEVAAYQGEMPGLLRKHFPDLNLSETSLSKWWQLQLANIGGQGLATDVLTVAKTETALNEALRLEFLDPEGIIRQKELSAWPELAGLPELERASAVRPAQDSLVRLSYRSFPSYRPILAEYEIVLGNLAKNSTADVAATLEALSSRRSTMTARAIHLRDYLDLYEINSAREISGTFDDYMRLKDSLKANPHQREDDLSKYLDRMEAIFIRAIDANQLQADPYSPEIDPMSSPLPELPPLPSH